MSDSFEESVNVSRETWARLRQYGDIVRKWQKTINLISPTTVGDLWERHILDSLQIWALDPQPKSWLDMGSGAGFPGIVTGICLAEHGAGWVYLIESNQKKAAFLRNTIVQTGARASVHPVRVADAFEIAPEIDAISARALASLDDLMEMSEPWFDTNKNLSTYLHKGRDYQLEIELARSRWDFNLVKYDSQIQDGSVILQIDSLKRL
ncbi:MAG: 16S rRNA (guanine(527)-N(7))-methyltransferase RsmG [Rhizobiaceae bacterium]|nr:16S rRNA (guanine(527)-N(7))-methyltransferase RsmG [Rhizobiaceae bacterium]